MEVLVVNNLTEYEKLIGSAPSLRRKPVITTSIEIYNKYQEKTQIINLWKYLNRGIIEEADKAAIRILQILNNNNRLDILYKDVNIFDISKISLLYFIKGVIHTSHSIRECIKEYKPTIANIKGNLKQTMGVVNYDKSDLLYGVSDFIFKKNNVVVKQYKIGLKPDKGTNKNFKINFSEYLFNIEDLINSSKDKKILIILAENFEWDFEICKYLLNKYKNVYVVLRTPDRCTKQYSNKCLPLFFDDFNYETKELEDGLRSIETNKNVFLGNKANLNSEYIDVFGNENLDFQFTEFYDRQKSYLTDLHTFDRIINFINPDKVYFSNSWDMSVRCMVKRALNQGIETFVSIHGGVVDNSGYLTRKFETSNYFVWGQDNFEGLVKAGQNESSIKIVGSMQMDFWNNRLKETDNNGSAKVSNEYDNIYNFKSSGGNKKDKFVITFFTSLGGGFSGHSINEIKHIESLKNIVDLAKRNKAIEFRIKPHILFDYFEFWENIIDKLPDNLKIIKENNLLEACDEMDLGVLLNVISNVAYEISLTCKPLIYLKDAVFDVECGESTIERGGILCLNSFEDFENIIVSYFMPKENKLSIDGINLYLENQKIKADLESRRKQFLKHSLSDFSKPVIERIENLIMNDNKSERDREASEPDIFRVIEWVSNYIKTNELKPYPDIKDFNVLPNGGNYINWIYKITENWCIYFNKENDIPKYFEYFMSNSPSEIGVDSKLKFKRKVYAKTRAMYLKYGLNENEKVRKIIKKIIN